MIKYEENLRETMNIGVRRASVDDAGAVATLLNAIVDEGGFSALKKKFSSEDEASFLASLGPRECVLLAEAEGGTVGFLTLEIYHKALGSTDHVASLGTFVDRDFREKGVGSALLEAAFLFAREKGYEKMIAEIRASNFLGLGLYRKFGFSEIGTLTRQVKIEGEYDDVIVMEMWL